MIIRLIPDGPLPSVLFTLSFTTPPPPTLPIPQSYVNQLQVLSQHDLDPPTSIHMLDKSVGILSLLHEVLFDLSSFKDKSRTAVKCTFIDGEVQEWTIVSEKCAEDLGGVLRDVGWSAMQAKVEEYERLGGAAQVNPSPPPPPMKKHKKQRSLLMSLVALVSSGSSSPSRRAPSPPPPGPPPAPPSTLSSHMLRRKARSALVNTFRRHVLPMLTSNLTASPFGYVAWIVKSILRQNDAKVEALIREAGLGLTLYSGDGKGSPLTPRAFKMMRSICSGTKSIPESPLFDDDDETGEGETSSTDTDGSSVHTPTDSLLHTTFPPSPLPTPKHRQLTQGIPRTPSPPSPPPSPTPAPHPKTLSTLNTLSTLSHRLQTLLSNLHQTHSSIKAEERQLLAVLEVKSRRRAWSNRDLLGGARVKDVGFGMPERGSSLSRCAATSEDVDLEFTVAVRDDIGREDVDGLEKKLRCLDIGLGAGPTRREERKRDVGMLFPVLEETEEDTREAQLVAPVPVSANSYEDCTFVGGSPEDSSLRLVEDAEKGCLLPLSLPRPSAPYPLQELPSNVSSSPPIRARTRSILLRDHNQHPALELDIQLNVNVNMSVVESDSSLTTMTVSTLSTSSSPEGPPGISAYTHTRSSSASSLSDDPYGPQTKIEIFDVGFGADEDYDDDDVDVPLSASAYQPPFTPILCSPSQTHSYPAPQHPWKDDLEGSFGEEFTLSMDVSPPGSPHSITSPLPLPISIPISKSTFQTSDDFSLPLPVSASRSKSRIGLSLGSRGRGMKVPDIPDDWSAYANSISQGIGSHR